jgi:acetyl esterase/lipase
MPETLHYGAAKWQFGQLWLPDSREAAPLVVLIHGGFWRAGKSLALTEPLAAAIREAGLAVWNIEYRAGEPDHDWPATLADITAAVDFAATLADRLVLVGHSAGGHLALRAAASRATRAEAVVSLAGICDMTAGARLGLGEHAVRDFLGGTPEEQPQRYAAACPARQLPLGVPQVLIHGLADDRVPVDISRGYARAARAAGDRVELIEVAGDHRALIEPATGAGRTVVSVIHDLALAR